MWIRSRTLPFCAAAASDMPESPPARTITSIEPQTHNADRRSIFLDGEFALGVHKDLIAKYGLEVGETLTGSERETLEAEDEYIWAKQTAFDYLAHKPRTEEEVRRRLRQQDVRPPVVEDVVARLYELDYLDDEAYADAYARNRFANKQYGPVRIRRELEQRGIARSLAEAAVDDLVADVDVEAAAWTHAEKRWSRLSEEQDPRRRKQKMHQYLHRRGFTSDTIYPIVDALERGEQEREL